MTDKQIIIDGCDVSGCIHRATNKIVNDIGTYCRCFTGSCKDIKNCHYKQLKAKEQECEELKSVRDSWISKCEQETKIRELFQDGLDQLKAENKHLNDLLNQALKELEEHREALEKVREIADRPYLLPCGGDCKQQNCTDKTTENGKHCMELKLIQILQICDEVKK